MQPLYLARIEDLGQGDFVKIHCAACHPVALLTPAALLTLGLSPAAKVLDLAMRFVPRVRSARSGGRFDQVRASERLTFASRDNQHASRAGLGELGYGSTAAAKEVAPQIPAQSPSDSSEIRIKDAPVSGQSSA
jgi:hypothetical protein